jgi:hypothetical protein
MIDAGVVFWAFVMILAFLGSMRGWVREMIVSFSMVFAIFAINELFKVPAVKDFINASPSPVWRWAFRAIPFLIISIFGYLGPAVADRANRFDKNVRGKFEEGILSLLLGALNGYLLFSTLAWFAAEAGILGNTAWPPSGQTLFRPPEGSTWLEYFFVKYAAIAYLHGTALVFVLIALVLFIIIVVI